MATALQANPRLFDQGHSTDEWIQRLAGEVTPGLIAIRFGGTRPTGSFEAGASPGGSALWLAFQGWLGTKG
jgi:hypothetical protein